MEELGRQKIKRIKSLSLKKYRQKYNKFILEGQKTLLDIPAIHIPRVDKIYCTKHQFSSELRSKFGDRCIQVEEKAMREMSNFITPPGCLAVVNAEGLFDSTENIDGPCLYLENINIPGNLGTMIRSADWFGFEKIFLSKGSVDLLNPKVLQAAMGSFWNIQFSIIALPDLLERNRGTKVFGTRMDGQDYRATSWPDSFLLIMGNESLGMSEASMALCTDFIGIPGRSQAVADSLNVAVSASIVMSSVAKKN